MLDFFAKKFLEIFIYTGGSKFKLKLCYLDSNIFSLVADDPESGLALRRYLNNKEICLSVSDINLVELGEATRKHKQIVEFICCPNTVVLKSQQNILIEEVGNYPRETGVDIIGSYLDSSEKTKKSLLENFLSQERKNSKNILREDASTMSKVLIQRKQNFPPSPSGKYIKEQASDFAKLVILGRLSKENPELLKNNIDINENYFRSLALSPYLSYFRYYLGNRTPNNKSDLGDFFHPTYLPFCNLAIVEKDMAENLRQIKLISPLISELQIEDIGFVRSLKLL